MDGLMSKLRKLDAYPKVNEDFYSRTLSGGVITIASSIVMFLLFFSELRMSTTATPLALPNISDSFSCLAQIEKSLQRHGGRLEHNETYCGSCYGAETSAEDCCHSCEEVLEAYRKKGWAMTNPEFNGPIRKNKLYECLISNYNIHAFICFNPGLALCFACNIQCKREGFLQRIEDEEGEGCNIYGLLEANKVAGNLHFSPGKSFQQSGVHVHDLLAFKKDSFNVSHDLLLGLSLHMEYQSLILGADIGRHQSLPGVFFFYDLSPIKVTFTEEHISFLHFLTNVCAIVGVLDESLVFVHQVSCSALLQLSSYYSPPFSQVLNNARTGYWP
ncbi:hypothetical protein DKX38_002475 [Salix brachista]|uniref:Endoplasmic reticulum vesicle transporter C-terminal domain-containing protein n=1 Tax=Salix brachista TaxID=2182728 RepID=A0A5N5NMY4_9ROSI|nr:hypothetical protein DKX38_002475 [Salix brachista]